MNSPYNRNNYKKRTPKQKTTTATANPTKNQNSNSTTNKKSKSNVLKGCNPSMFFMSVKELLNRLFHRHSYTCNYIIIFILLYV